MRDQSGFMKISSLVVKVSAWIFLFFGIINSIGVIMSKPSVLTVGTSIVSFAFNIFIFFFLYLITKIADMLIKILNEVKKEENK